MAKNITTEIELVQACIKGNNAAFEGLVGKYQSLVCAITYGATGDVEKSEELAHETFVRAWKDLGQLRELAKFKAWLCSIARTTVINYLRRQQRNILRNAAGLESARETASEASDPGDELIAKEQQAVIARALMQLPESYREPLILFYRQEHSTKEVARLLDLSDENVRTRLHRGRKMLKEHLADMLENTLSSTAPGKAFTAIVMASVAGLVVKSSAAAAAVTVTAATSSGGATATATAAILSSTAAKIVTAAAIVAIAVGSTIAIKSLKNKDMPAGPDAKRQNAIISETENNSSAEDQDAVIAKTDADDAKNIENNNDQTRPVKTAGAASDNSRIMTTTSVAADEDTDNDIKGVLGLKVINKETGGPIENADVKVYNYFKDVKRSARSGKTDRFGRIDVVCEEKMVSLEISVNAPERVPTKISFRDNGGNVQVPLNYILALEKGTSIGCVIINEKKQPIKDVNVKLYVPIGNRDVEKPDIRDYTVKTDANGLWRCNIMPSELQDVRVKLGHPDYIDDFTYGVTKRPSIKELRAMSGIMVMKRGLSVGGIVKDIEGNPIKNARVLQGYSRIGSDFPSTKTDENGEFIFANAETGEMILTAVAKGKSPDQRIIQVRPNLGLVEFILEPAKTIKGRIVDTDGKPIQDAFATIDSWRYTKALFWNVKTNKEGRFQWKQAPSDEVGFSFGKQGYMGIEGMDLKASDEEYEIVMYRSLKVSGKVTDSETGEEIKSFALVTGSKYKNNDQISWSSRDEKFKDGRYTVTFTESEDGYGLKVIAKGYLPSISREFKETEEDVVFDFALKKGEYLSGTVYLPDGTPAEGVEVMLSTRSDMRFKNGEYVKKSLDCHSVTDPNGTFYLEPQIEDYVIAAVSENGWAKFYSSELDGKPELVLQPWAAIKGSINVGAESTFDAGITIESSYDIHKPGFKVNSETTADKKYYFEFNRVIPGDYYVSYKNKSNVSTYSFGRSDSEYIQVKPGETADILIGNKGRPVKGRLTTEAGSEGMVNFKSDKVFIRTKYSDEETIKITGPTPKFPQGFAAFSKGQQNEWMQKRSRSKEMKEYHEKIMPLMETQVRLRKNYPVVINKDGTFEVERVAEGSYQLKGSFVKPVNEGVFDDGKVAGYVEFDFTVDKIEGGFSDEPLDLGKIKVNVIKYLKIGQKADDFQFKDIDGNTIKISDFRGKFVLIDIWRREGREDAKVGLEEMERLYKQFGSDKELVIVSITNGDSTPPDLLKQYIKHFNMKWVVGLFKDSKAMSQILKQYGSNGVPARLLLGPDMEVLGIDLKGRDLTDSIKIITAP